VVKKGLCIYPKNKHQQHPLSLSLRVYCKMSVFSYRDGSLYAEQVAVSQLAQQFGKILLKNLRFN
jgi:hypothetical protein